MNARRSFLLSVGLVVTSVSVTLAQNAPVPDFANVPMIWNKAGNTLTRLKSEPYSTITRGGKVSYTFNGATSEVRADAASDFGIIFKLNDATIRAGSDPATFTHIYRLRVKRKSREALYMTIGGFGKTKVEISNQDEIGYELKKLGEGVYELLPKGGFVPGEYAVGIAGSNSTFGIDK